MTEAGFWERWVSPALNRNRPEWVAWKMGPGNRPGFPDILYCLDGHVGLIELKYLDEPPKRRTTRIRMDLRANQSAHLREWHEAAGTAFVLLGVGRLWYLLPHSIADRRPMSFYADRAFDGPQPLDSIRLSLANKVLAYRN